LQGEFARPSLKILKINLNVLRGAKKLSVEVEKHISNINKEYVKKRQKFGIKKRIIVPDSEFNRKFLKDYAKDVTDFKMVSHKDLPAFKTVMQIYDNKVSYLTLTEDFMIGIIIEDPNIYKMHKYLFEHLWNITEDLNL
jgi:hypothetical protein